MEVLPSSKSPESINNRPDNFTELWILPLGNYINILQRNKSQTYRLNFFFKDIKKPFSSPASPILPPLFQISSQDLENTFGFRLGFGLLGDLPHGNRPTPSWQLSSRAPPSLFPELPWATLRIWPHSLPKTRRWDCLKEKPFLPWLGRTATVLSSGPHSDSDILRSPSEPPAPG